jgi:nucleotide-binding universal stress UspA family protein
MKQTLVVAVDGSVPSRRGLTVATSLAKAMGLELELVNVQPPILLPPAAYEDTIRAIEAAQTRESRALLDAESAAPAAAGVGVVTTSLVGSPAEAIADLSREERVWGIVVGAKGHSAVGRVLLGSVADRLVHICTKPVLVVR